MAERKIEQIGYERLRIYFLSRRQRHLPGKPFVPGTTYTDIVRLYECDARLRDVCFVAVGQFEILLRNAMSEVLSSNHGAHPYFVSAAFRDADANREALKLLLDMVARSKDARVAHYRTTYGDPLIPPIWTLKEVLTFGGCSRLLKHLAGTMRTAIAAEFGVPNDAVFLRWVECLVDLRNICAHHDRLFNRSFQKQPTTLVSAAVPTAPRGKLKAVLECLDHMLAARGAPYSAVAKVDAIVRRCTAMQLAEAGY
ncbi:Abi family protein [Sphingomonas sp.]|uniref:Abi family protein n=1 Tax=Sphingomonas sp. TaxID=28214 RepID=UPI0035BBE48D